MPWDAAQKFNIFLKSKSKRKDNLIFKVQSVIKKVTYYLIFLLRMSQSSTPFSLFSQPIITKDVQNRIPVPALMSNSKMSQVQNSSSSNSNSNTNSNTNDNPSMQDLMNLIKGQSSLINSLQKTISSLQNTIDGLNLKLEEFENGSRGINKDVN